MVIYCKKLNKIKTNFNETLIYYRIADGNYKMFIKRK